MIENKKILQNGLTFDDVLVIPSYSELMPSETNITTSFSKNIKINIPILSAAMDTVTESKMAISLAREGGIGVLHKNMSIAQQASEVRKVKRSESGMIQDPVTLSIDSTVGDALDLMKEHRIGGIPIVKTSENLVTTKLKDLENAEKILKVNKIEKLPVVDDDYKLVGLITFKDITKNKMMPNSCKDSLGRLRVAAAVGITNDVLDRVSALNQASVDAIVIDTAHGHSKNVVDVLKKLKKKFSYLDFVVGNVATADAAKLLIENGADAIKVGIGPGSICTTRIIAGIGVPQLTAILNVAEVAKKSNVPVIADGGIRYSGDIVKALVAGASSVMLGSMFAGVEEGPGKTIIFEGRKFKSYRGMGSIDAMESGSKDRYFQADQSDNKKLVPEGIVGRVAHKGTLSEVVHQILGGIRAGMGYTGSKDIIDLQKSYFTKISSSGMTESHPHNVTITKEAPNYSRK